MSKVAYVRVSTAEQNEARQREALSQNGIDKWFIEKASGKNTDRPEFQKMMDWIREGDTIYIHDLSRIARSTKDLLGLLDILEAKGVSLVSDKENIDTNNATGKLIVTIIAAINQFERENLLERQREGIAIAKREGRYKGRKPVVLPDIERHYERYMNREVSKAALARELGISRPTLDKLFSEYEEAPGLTGGASLCKRVDLAGSRCYTCQSIKGQTLVCASTVRRKQGWPEMKKAYQKKS